MSAPEQPPPSPSGPRIPELAEQALIRAGGAPLIAGNSLRLLRDSTENYPAWLDAIHRARRVILFENYIIEDDEVGREFVAALAARAREGVRVRLIYDWLGTPFSGELFAPLIQAGGEVRCFNPFRLDSPFGWITRDHRKLMVVDSEVAFVSGLCISHRWNADPARGLAAWRDTGVELRGPAIADVELAFASLWATMGPPMPESDCAQPDQIPPAGDTTLMVIATEPNRPATYRLDQLIAALARHTLWISDAYLVAPAPYLQALRAAVEDGVDVRVLVPGASDIPITAAFSRAGYRPLLEMGVRVFEWNGSMMHAKTAVADGEWLRVGSSNLNVSSIVANYELDVAAHDENIAQQMEEWFLRDLQNATEIVLGTRNRVQPTRNGLRRWRLGRRPGSVSRAAAGALRIGSAVGAAITNRRLLGPAEAGIMWKVGAVLMVLAVLGMLWPEAVAVPIGLIGGWIGLALLARAWKLRRQSDEEAEDEDEGEKTD